MGPVALWEEGQPSLGLLSGTPERRRALAVAGLSGETRLRSSRTLETNGLSAGLFSLVGTQCFLSK